MEEIEARKFFYGFQNHFSDMGLDNLKKFMETLGNPQNKVKVIHVAGTNGKGSVSSFIANILTESGFKTGRYNSPVVFEQNENIIINNNKITDKEFAVQVELMKPAIEAADREKRLPTIFEMETALAYQYFAYSQCDFAVIECGMGGQNDATNITNATILSIFTSISMDHMSYLGNTLKEIAKCKAGIIKRNASVLMIEQNREVMQVIAQEAQKQNADITVVKKGNIQILKASLSGQKFIYTGSTQKAEEYNIQMPGSFQAENAAEAVEAVYELVRQGYKIEQTAVERGLYKVVLPGRFQVIKKENPIIVIDGGHNPGAALRLKENMEQLLKGMNLIFVMAVFADKDYKKVVEITCDLADNIYTVRARGERALEAEKLADCIRISKKQAYVMQDVHTAIEAAVSKADELTAENGKKSAVICFGTFSFLKQIREIVSGRRKDNEN